MATFLKPTVTRCQAHEADNLSDAEALSYIQYINVGHKVVAHNIQVGDVSAA